MAIVTKLYHPRRRIWNLWKKKAVWLDDIKTIAIQSYHPRGRRHHNPETRKLKNQINNLQIEKHAVHNTMKYPDEVETNLKRIINNLRIQFGLNFFTKKSSLVIYILHFSVYINIDLCLWFLVLGSWSVLLIKLLLEKSNALVTEPRETFMNLKHSF